MNLNYTEIEKYIDKSKVRYNEAMSKHTTLKVGGSADIMAIPDDINDIVAVLKYAKKLMLPVTIVGNGSKLLVLDKGIRGVVIKLGSKFSNYEIDKEYITVYAGMTLPKLAIIARDNELSGLEFAAGIPGNVGGSVYMNAGAYGSEMSKVIEEVTFIDKNLNICTLQCDKLEFGYRESFFKKHGNDNVIISAKLKLNYGDKEAITNTMKENNESRKIKQPLEYPNAGSTFKRPEGYFVGKLIDDLNLKGYSIGGAEVSTKHSGFIVNKGNAKAKDVIDLIEYIKEKVLKANGVKLQEEIIVLGEGE